MRNAQDHNAAISMAISIVSLPRHSPVRSQIFKWLEKSIQEQELPHHSNLRSEEHTSELQSLMRISYAVFCLKKTSIHLPLRLIDHIMNNVTDMLLTRNELKCNLRERFPYTELVSTLVSLFLVVGVVEWVLSSDVHAVCDCCALCVWRCSSD